MSSASFSKVSLRKQLIHQRLALSPRLWQHKSLQICHYLQQSPHFQAAQVILTYTSLKQEPDLRSLVQAYPAKMWGLPRCIGQSLTWHQWTWGDPLVAGSYGILEPSASAATIAPPDVDVLWLPAVACDRNFYRLGYGGGYFDRLLCQPDWQHVFRVGIVFEYAHLSELPVESWDQRLDAICTEAGYQVANPTAQA